MNCVTEEVAEFNTNAPIGKHDLGISKQPTAPINGDIKIKMFDKLKELKQSFHLPENSILKPDDSFTGGRRLSSRSSTISRKNSRRSSEKRKQSLFGKQDNLNYGMHRMSLAGMVHHNNTKIEGRTSNSSRSNSDRKNGSAGRPSVEEKRGSTEFQNVMRMN